MCTFTRCIVIKKVRDLLKHFTDLLTHFIVHTSKQIILNGLFLSIDVFIKQDRSFLCNFFCVLSNQGKTHKICVFAPRSYVISSKPTFDSICTTFYAASDIKHDNAHSFMTDRKSVQKNLQNVFVVFGT